MSCDNDDVEAPSHYFSPDGAEINTFIAHLPFYRGSVIKYVFRAGKKSADTELKDLKKAAKCLRIEISRLEKK